MKKWISTMMMIFLVISFLGGCGNTNQAEPPKVDTVVDLYPLEKDNYWKYEVEGQANDFIEERVIYQEGNKAQLAVTDSATVMAIVYEFQEDGQKLVAINSREEYFAENSLLAEEARFSNVILQSPIAVGTTWSGDGLTYTITAIDAEVQTPLETFSGCVVVEAKDSEGTFSNTAYYKAGVGLVKEVAQGEEYRKVKNLIEYH